MKKHRSLKLSSALCALGCTIPFAGQATGGESLDRLGRLIGFGWSDGYHACAENGFQLGENLPPRSYTADHALYASNTMPATHGHYRRPHAACETCNGGGRTDVHSMEMLNAPVVEQTPVFAEPVPPGPITDDSLSVPPPVPAEPAEPEPDLLLDEPSDALGPENPASPSDRMPAPKPPRAQQAPSPAVAPVKPTQPAAPPKKTATPATPIPQPPMPEESDDDLLLDLPSDSDGLIDELPPPARDPLSPENSTYHQRSRMRNAPVRQTAAELPVSRPSRLGAQTPQRLPSTR